MNTANSNYLQQFKKSIETPEAFWADAAKDIDWRKTPTQILDRSQPPFYRWFADGELNTCENALDRHVKAGRGDQAALIYDSPVTKITKSWSYSQLLANVAKLAGALRNLNVQKGDRVIIYMPMIPEAVMAMLACSRIGAVHSVVFGGFAAAELAARIDDAKPRVILSASAGLEAQKVIAYKPLLDHAIELAQHKPEKCLIYQRQIANAAATTASLLDGRDFDWQTLVSAAEPAEAVPVRSADPSYILYTSGTTGHPKGIVRDTGGHAVALRWSMPNIYGAKPNDVFWTASDVGWVVGHSYIVYAPLLFGCTTLLYEGKPVGTPDAGAFWRVIEQHKVNVLFTAPTAFRAIKRDDPNGEFVKKHNTKSLRSLFLAGERSDSTTLEWAENQLHVPIIDHWWQTETGWPIVANCLGLGPHKVKHGSPTKPVPGWDVRSLDEAGHECPAGQVGSLVCKLPLPPGSLLTLWQNDERFRESYMNDYPGYYKTADAGMIDEDGYVHVLARTDDIINVAGHRLSTGVMEECLARLPDVAECAVIGVADEIKGEVPMGLLVLKSGATISESEVVKQAVERVRADIGPVASFKLAFTVKRLPKTRSGKILRGTIKKIAENTPFKMPATIDDPAILEEIAADLKRVGLLKK